MSDRVGVLLIGGFLGAGKTTLLRRLIGDPEVGGRLAVLVNELGALGLDGELIEAARGVRESAALRTVQLDSGCLCCTLKGELGEALAELARPSSGPPPAQIIVELSGAALASEVHFQLSTQALEAPYYPDGLVCVVDARAAPRRAREAEGLFVDQLSRADLVLLSKLDLASEAEAETTRALLARLAPSARVIPCTRGDVDPSLLLGIDPTRAPAPPPDHGHGIAVRTIELHAPITAAALRSFLDEHAPALFRIKGIVDVAGVGPQLVQCVGDQIELSTLPAADTRRRLIFIGAADAEVARAVAAAERLVG